MNRITKIEQENNFLLPESYKKLLADFELFMEIEFKDKDMDIMNKNLVTEPIKKPLQCWQYVNLWVSEDDRIKDNKVIRHDLSSETIDTERVKNSFMFGSYGDGVRLYFDVLDNMSVWEYWLDEGSVGKIADSFDEIVKHGEIIDKE